MVFVCIVNALATPCFTFAFFSELHNAWRDREFDRRGLAAPFSSASFAAALLQNRTTAMQKGEVAVAIDVKERAGGKILEKQHMGLRWMPTLACRTSIPF